jgi:hypothetical protein
VLKFLSGYLDMHRFMSRVTVLSFCLLAVSLFAQENRVIQVGVATMKNAAGLAVPGTLERDHLVAALNQQKPDKKQHLAVQGVPLDGTSPDEAASEAKDKKCDYVVYTTLVELRSSSDPAQIRPGTVETNPNGVWSQRNNPRAQAIEPEYRATVEYRLYRSGESAAMSGAPFSTQQALPEDAVVAQVMDRIASRVFADIKKTPPPLHE